MAEKHLSETLEASHTDEWEANAHSKKSGKGGIFNRIRKLSRHKKDIHTPVVRDNNQTKSQDDGESAIGKDKPKEELSNTELSQRPENSASLLEPIGSSSQIDQHEQLKRVSGVSLISTFSKDSGYLTDPRHSTASGYSTFSNTTCTACDTDIEYQHGTFAKSGSLLTSQSGKYAEQSMPVFAGDPNIQSARQSNVEAHDTGESEKEEKSIIILPDPSDETQTSFQSRESVNCCSVVNTKLKVSNSAADLQRCPSREACGGDERERWSGGDFKITHVKPAMNRDTDSSNSSLESERGGRGNRKSGERKENKYSDATHLKQVDDNRGSTSSCHSSQDNARGKKYNTNPQCEELQSDREKEKTSSYNETEETYCKNVERSEHCDRNACSEEEKRWKQTHTRVNDAFSGQEDGSSSKKSQTHNMSVATRCVTLSKTSSRCDIAASIPEIPQGEEVEEEINDNKKTVLEPQDTGENPYETICFRRNSSEVKAAGFDPNEDKKDGYESLDTIEEWVQKFHSLAEVPVDISGLSINEVACCMKLLGLSQYVDAFRNRGIDGLLLSQNTITESILNNLGWNPLDIVVFLAFVKGWRGKPSESTNNGSVQGEATPVEESDKPSGGTEESTKKGFHDESTPMKESHLPSESTEKNKKDACLCDEATPVEESNMNSKSTEDNTAL